MILFSLARLQIWGTMCSVGTLRWAMLPCPHKILESYPGCIKNMRAGLLDPTLRFWQHMRILVGLGSLSCRFIIPQE